jgi:hypothetical protein
MRRLILATVALVLFLGLLMQCCKPDTSITDHKAYVEGLLNGSHEIRKMTTTPTASGHISGSFFIGCGGIGGDYEASYKVLFSWKGNDGRYRIMKLPYESFVVSFDESADVPMVRFDYERGLVWGMKRISDNNLADIVKVAYVTCCESDWTLGI